MERLFLRKKRIYICRLSFSIWAVSAAVVVAVAVAAVVAVVAVTVAVVAAAVDDD